MEDDKIKGLLQEFQPELSSDLHFMARLRRSMDAVEIVKQHNARQRRRCRIAVAVAAMSGFIAGSLLTLLFPAISQWLSSITVQLPSIGLPPLSINGKIAALLLICATSATIALNAYDLALSKLSHKE